MPSGRGGRNRERGLADLLTKNKQLAAALEKEKGSCARLKDELIELRHRDLKSYEEVLAMKQAVTGLTTKFAQIQALAQEASSLAEHALGEPAGAPQKTLTPSSRRMNNDTRKSLLLSRSSESPTRVTQLHPPEQHPNNKQTVTPHLPTVGAMGRQTKQLRQQKGQVRPNSYQWPVRRLSDLQWPARKIGPEPVNCCKTPLDLPSSGTVQPAYPYDFGSSSPHMTACVQPSEAPSIDSSESATTANSCCETSPNLPLGSDNGMESILRDIEEKLETTTLLGLGARSKTQPTLGGQTDKHSRKTNTQENAGSLERRAVTGSKAKKTNGALTAGRALMEITNNTHSRPWGPDTVVVPMTTLDLVDLSTSLPSPICEDTALHALHLTEVVVHQESPTSGHVQPNAIGQRTAALEDVASVGPTAPLVLPVLEMPRRKERAGTSMSCSLTGGKNQPEAPKGDSPSRNRGRSAIPQRASLHLREALPDIQQVNDTQARRSSRTSTAKTISYKEQPLNGKQRRGDPGSDPFFLDTWKSRLMKVDQNRPKLKQKQNL